MNSAQPLEHKAVADNDALFLERVTAIADGPLAALAYSIDQEGHYPLDIIRSLG